MKNNQTPEIRFPGFIETWEKRKFQDFISKAGKKNTMGENYSAYSVSNKLGLVSQTEQFDGSRLDDLDKTSYKLVNPNEFAYNPARINVGSIAFNNLNKTVIVSSLYVVLKMSEELDNEFILQFIKSQLFNHEVRRNTEGSVREYLFFENFKNIKFPYTSSKDEQANIGNFFKQLDDTIALHQQELNTLKQTKQGFLQKMFPKEGESVPEVRFPGFTEDWEQRELDSIYEKIRNAFVGTATPYYVEDGHFYLESNNVKDGQINRDTEVFINDEFYEKQKDNWLHTGDLVMVQSGHVGHTAVIPEELDNTAAHALIMFSKYREKNDPYFLNYQFQTNKAKEKLKNITTGNTIKHILASEMKKFLVDMPKYEEQQTIGNFFRLIDSTIALHKRELDDLKETKKAFLQKMFV